MNKLIEIVELLDQENKFHEQIKKIQNQLHPIQDKIKKINDDIPFNPMLNEFICHKIIETYDDEQMLQLEEYRKELENNKLHNSVTYSSNKIFDPYNDSWYIYDYEKEGDKIRFKLSCRKNEGSISGMYTFLDTHYTNWFKISELEMLD